MGRLSRAPALLTSCADGSYESKRRTILGTASHPLCAGRNGHCHQPTADAGEPLTRPLHFRVSPHNWWCYGCIFTIVGLLASSGSWQDEFPPRYCGVFVMSLIGLVLCLFRRSGALHHSERVTVFDYWASTTYCLLPRPVLLSLLFYYSNHRRAQHGLAIGAAVTAEGARSIRPSTYAAVQLATRRRGRR